MPLVAVAIQPAAESSRHGSVALEYAGSSCRACYADHLNSEASA